MERLEWLDRLSIGNETIDSQHRHLFELYNRMFDLSEGEIDRDALLVALLNYASVHFVEEEALMLRIEYPRVAFEAHKRQHGDFVKKLEGLRDHPVYVTLDYIREWLLRHIFIEDRRIGVFMKGAYDNSED